ncbi:conserved hypothetical protein [Thermoanaerobacter mathranii subsp. mathranii str. A3]|jgi:hypothetical protein|uniref:Uncharacterized protein n=3 Tax=Thermoanaerobacter TaxID=1754 RepID=D3T2L6_THEIA|nr:MULTISPECIES: hypothetical protein [Thermoanaerobacter]ADD02468.1 conserved hypothetical protein [Thermoanaerobacter italicus Ab9]ADH60970.1 conserved hypothetical protein [Thermoanaerobacter mathranii subsp. mathranii str. A3]MDP9749923.1 hypothetical protein [Thermoanaerobacter pentosaceus]
MSSNTPIDLKTILPRAVEVGNLKQIDLQKPVIYSQQIAISSNKENEIKKTKPNELEKTEKTLIKERQNSEQKNKQEKNPDKKNKKTMGHIDIKV